MRIPRCACCPTGALHPGAMDSVGEHNIPDESEERLHLFGGCRPPLESGNHVLRNTERAECAAHLGRTPRAAASALFKPWVLHHKMGNSGESISRDKLRLV